jgi:hypothetical protein
VETHADLFLVRRWVRVKTADRLDANCVEGWLPWSGHTMSKT